MIVVRINHLKYVQGRTTFIRIVIIERTKNTNI
jgi:hypothetical protein